MVTEDTLRGEGWRRDVAATLGLAMVLMILALASDELPSTLLPKSAATTATATSAPTKSNLPTLAQLQQQVLARRKAQENIYTNHRAYVQNKELNEASQQGSPVFTPVQQQAQPTQQQFYAGNSQPQVYMQNPPMNQFSQQGPPVFTPIQQQAQSMQQQVYAGNSQPQVYMNQLRQQGSPVFTPINQQAQPMQQQVYVNNAPALNAASPQLSPMSQPVQEQNNAPALNVASPQLSPQGLGALDSQKGGNADDLDDDHLYKLFTASDDSSPMASDQNAAASGEPSAASYNVPSTQSSAPGEAKAAALPEVFSDRGREGSSRQTVGDLADKGLFSMWQSAGADMGSSHASKPANGGQSQAIGEPTALNSLDQPKSETMAQLVDQQDGGGFDVLEAGSAKPATHSPSAPDDYGIPEGGAAVPV